MIEQLAVTAVRILWRLDAGPVADIDATLRSMAIASLQRCGGGAWARDLLRP